MKAPQTKMDRKQFFLLIAAVALAVSISAILGNVAKKTFPRAGNPFTTEHWECGGTDAQTSTSSVALLYPADTASTTCTVPSGIVDGADSIDLNLNLGSTTTPPTLAWTYEFSNYNSNWFPEDGTTVPNNTNVTHGARPVIHRWTFATTSNSANVELETRNITVTPTATKYMRINFGVAGTGAKLHMQIVSKKQY